MAKYSQKTAKYINNTPLRWEDGKIHNLPQDYADMMCWQELAQYVTDAYNSLSDEEKENCSVYAEEYCTAGAVFFYGKKYGLPEPICFNDNFLLWAPDSLHTQTFIYVNDEVGDMKWAFNNVVNAGTVNNKYFREDGEFVMICKEPVSEFFHFYADKVKTLKNKYR